MTKHEEKLAKLVALADGETNEAAALAAITKAQEYADKHGLSIEEARAAKAKGDTARISAKRSKSGYGKFCDADNYLLKPLSVFCNVKAYNNHVDAEGNHCLDFVGDEVDVELVNYLRKIISRAMRHEFECYRDFVWAKESPTTRKSVVAVERVFKAAMALRLKERMQEVKAPSMATPTGKELVVIKKDLILKYAVDHGMKDVTYGAAQRIPHDAKAAHFGRAAGNNVSFGRGVEGNGPKQLGAR